MTLPSRADLAADPELGIGNVLTTLVAHGVGLDVPALTFDTELDAHPAWQALTLRQLDRAVRARAASLHAAGVRRRDPIAVYVGDVADHLLSFLALARIGAIPALINGGLAPEIAAAYIENIRAASLLADPSRLTSLAALGVDLPPALDVARIGAGDPDAAPPPFRHHASDITVITHSSGTTGIPKAVAHSHHSLFAGIRHRLGLPIPRGMQRMISALPPPHAATLANTHLALASRTELAILSRQHGSYVLDAIERWRPEIVVGFATTWSELACEDLEKRDLGSVRMWWNTGDCAHEAHVRRVVAAGHRDVVTRGGVVQKPGSVFVDGLGSSEMGYSQFYIAHTPESNRYGRCIGRPHAFSDIAVFDDDGQELGPGQVGELGVKSPSLSVGYWNDSVLTARTRLRGYFLTGDLAYRDEGGDYYYLDRRADSVRLDDGRWVHTALSEERVLSRCPDIHECTVVAVRDEAKISTAVLCILSPNANPEVDRSAEIRGALEAHVAATEPEIIMIEAERLPLTTTGKVRKVRLREGYLRGDLFSDERGRTAVLS
jgi:acyl-coenzyme A synthetase/AMP-(fatty) acid ligase